MAIQHAKFHTFLIGKETTFGTAVAATKDVGLVQSFTPSDKRTIEQIYSAGGREISELVAAKFEVAWDLEVNLQNGRLFEYIFGTVGHTFTDPDTKHAFSVIATDVPSMTIETSFNSASDSVFIYDGSKINSATVNLPTNGILNLTCSGLSQGVSTATAEASVAVIDDIATLHYKHSTLSTGGAGTESSVGKLQTFNVTMENNLLPVDSTGVIVVQELVAQNFLMTFDFTMMFENVTEYEIFLGGTTPQTSPTKKSAEFAATNGVALGSGRREFSIQLDDFLYEEAGTPVTVGESVVQSFKGTATDLGTNGCFYVDDIAEADFV